MFFSKSEEIKNLVGAHADAVLNCYEAYERSLIKILKGASKKEIKELTKELRHLESEADTVRHNIIRTMLEGGLLVDSRKSLMRVIEGVDVIADTVEDIIQEIDIQQIHMPEFTHEGLIKMSEVTKAQLDLLIEGLKKIVSKYSIKEMTKLIRKIEALESEVDNMQQDLVRQLFKTDLTLAEKMQYRDVINLIGSMSDQIEDISDAVEIIMMARKV